MISGPVKDNPLSYKYVKILRLFLYPIGGWPGEAFGENVPLLVRCHNKYAALQSFVITCGQAYYIYKYFNVMNFFLKGDCYITTGLGVMTSLRCILLSLKKYENIAQTFLMSFHLGHYKHKGAYYRKMHATIDKVSYYFTLFSMFLVMGGMILFNFSPIYQNYKNGIFFSKRSENTTTMFSIYYCFPGFNPMKNFTFATIYNFLLSYICCSSVCALDLFLFLMVFQIFGHIQILRNNLEILPKPVQAMFDAEENEIIRKMLIECIDHHIDIIKFTEELSSFFGPALGYNYTFHLGGCCLLLLECSQGDSDAIIRFGPLTLIVFAQLIQTSVIFEMIGTVSEKLKDSVYDTPWECMDTRNRRIVCILLNRVQTPLRVTAMGLTTVGVNTMAGILRTTFSYFAFLRSMTRTTSNV